ncbi:UNVERIFIED_CONTAM: Disease resistance protein [Sesamum indicum]
MAKVMDLLSTQEVKRIGIWGMGGVGKTTLIKNINNKLTTPSPVSDSFCIVIWVTVSNKTPETELELKKMTEVTLKIEVLNEEEAWRLFCRSAGEVATSEELEPLARAVTKECAGLPLAIDVVGASLKGKRMIQLWNDALNALRRSEPLIRGRIEDRVYNPIKWSYDEHHDIEEVMDRGVAIIETLTECSLLEQDPWSNVKVHDVIRDVSVWISSLHWTQECLSLVRSGIGLHKMRKVELLTKSYKRISFMDNQLRELPNGLGECPTISTLLLQRNKMLEEIPEQFLLAFMSLRILDLSECKSIKSLPPCLDQLVELRAVHLYHCSNLETLPPVGRLAKLQVLVCCGTGISTLPQGMEKLTSLKLLDLSHNMLTTVPVETISCLSNLEYLNLSGNYKLKFIGDVSTQFQKLLSNERLVDLFIGVGSSGCIPETTDALLNRIKKLKNFQLFIGPSNTPNISIGGYSLKQVHLGEMHLSGQRMEWLFASMHAIIFSRCNGLGTMFEKLVANSDEVGGFDTVEILYIFGCPDWVGVGSNAKFDMLPNLKDIHISTFTNMSCISDLALPLGLKFSRLQYMTISKCSQLKYLISLGTIILALENLLGVVVSNCEQVEELFKFDQTSGLDSVFPNLKRIALRHCPRLRFLSELNIAFPHLEEVVVENCPLLKKLPVTLQNVGTIKKIRGELKWWDQLEWESDDFKKLYIPVLRLY